MPVVARAGRSRTLRATSRLVQKTAIRPCGAASTIARSASRRPAGAGDTFPSRSASPSASPSASAVAWSTTTRRSTT
ncbi:MAG TPA: hypothetical protein VK943_14810 [Arenibaculum sp.]|nr:hypothetical protein [Arenibaculum sp.]